MIIIYVQFSIHTQRHTQIGRCTRSEYSTPDMINVMLEMDQLLLIHSGGGW